MLKQHRGNDDLKRSKPVSADVEFLARLLDGAFQVPGSRIRFGLDALIGIVPGVGDALTSLLSLYILHAAGRHGLPRTAVLRMAVNLIIDLTLGAIPIFGDVFDIFWRANEKNVALLRRHLTTTSADSRKARFSDWLFLGAVACVLLAVCVAGMVITYTLVAWLGRALI